MDKLISQQAAINAIEKHLKWTTIPDYYPGIFEAVRGWLNELPSAQPEIIRCKDCKYCEHWYADKGRCFLWHEGSIDVFEKGFCNYAERREE